VLYRVGRKKKKAGKTVKEVEKKGTPNLLA